MDLRTAAADGKKLRGARGGDARQRAGALQQAVEKRHARGGLRIGARRQRNVGHQQVTGPEAGLDILQPVEAPQQQARAGQQNHRETDLADHQDAT